MTMSIRIEVSEKDLPAFLACLGIGTLKAIQSGLIPTQAGIWSLAAPVVHTPDLFASPVAQRIFEVLAECDELGAIKKLMPDRFDATVASLIEKLESELAEIEDPIWRIFLEKQPDLNT